MSTSQKIKLPEISITNYALKQVTPNESVVASVDVKEFDKELNLTLNALSDAINTPVGDYGISVALPTPISIDIEKFVDISLPTLPSWMYMTKVDMNVYLSAFEPNYGEYLALPVKGIQVLNAPDFANLESNKHLQIVNDYEGEYDYFDENLNIKRTTGTNLNVVKNTDCTDDGYYRWCTIYSCQRNLTYSDALSALDIRYIAQSDENGKVLNSLSSSISSMDFSYLNEPFIINKDNDYIFVLRTKYVPNLSSYSFFSPESMADVTYFRCNQYVLKPELDITYLSSVLHGNCWIGWNDSHMLSAELKNKDMLWVWNSQTTNAEKASHSHKYVSPFNLVKDKDGYNLLSTTVITKYIADKIYANKTRYSVDGRQTLIGQFGINEFSSVDEYVKNTMSEHEHEIYLLKNDSMNAADCNIVNVADPLDNRDAANKQYVDAELDSLSGSVFTALKDIDMTNVTELALVISVLSAVVERFSR